MIVDTSALLAIVFQEPGYEAVLERITSSPAAAGAPTLAEAGIVLHARLGDGAAGLLERMLDELDIQEVPFGEVHWREAVDAFRRFGKGRHAAGLNFGDCMTYAVAHLAGEPLLYIGDDFGQTDLPSSDPTGAPGR
jgi:ribonuclease VapC